MDRKLDFVIIGAQKAGTTSLHEYLRQHPLLFLPEEKDFVVFMDDQPANIPEADLWQFLRPARPGQLLGLSYVDLLYFPECPGRMHRYNPRLKLIAVLRDPVNRAYSNFRYNVAYGRETARSFEEALEREEERRGGSWRDKASRTYLSHGHYAEQLSRFLRFFPREQLHVVLSEELGGNPGEAVRSVFRFLDVDESIPLDFRVRKNAAAIPLWAPLQRFMWSPPPLLWKTYQSLPLSFKRFVRYRIVAGLNRLNLSERRSPEMDPALRQRLSTYFAGHNRRLAELIGRDLTGWT